ncbi:FHA domain-containing protein [Actinoplanes solisilvae]|uniref:FHA domain-containing protein n=1 Tax=Actinoplanes solisilvae TaxID=2486853 RepID=UPI000FDBBEEF|nr:FHA domain-containing protein [Actinoplanes solisilvae]
MNDQFRSPGGAPTTRPNPGATLRPIGTGESFELVVNEPLKLGRGSDNPKISRMLSPFTDVGREHALVILDNSGCVVVTDLDAANGTWVGGERMTSRSSRTVRLPAKLRLGKECFLTLVENPVGPVTDAS